MFKIVHAANLQMWKILNVIKNSLANWKMEFTLIPVRDFCPPNHELYTKWNACISHSNASKLAMLPSQMIPNHCIEQPCQCNPS